MKPILSRLLLWLNLFWLTGCVSVEEVKWEEKNIEAIPMRVFSPTQTAWGAGILIDSLWIERIYQGALFQYSVFNLRQDTLVYCKSFLAKGNGPEEILTPQAFVSYEDRQLVVRDIQPGGKILTVDFDQLSTVTKPEFNRVPYTTLELLGWFVSAYPIDATTWLGTKDLSSLFSVVNLADQTVTALNLPYPQDGSLIDDPYEKMLAYGGTILKKPFSNRFVYVAQINRYMEIFDIENQRAIRVATPYKEYPKYGDDGTGYRTSDDAFLGAKLAVTERYIYVMMNDVTYLDMRKQTREGKVDWWYSDRVFVFDWDGNPIVKYNLDQPVYSMVVSQDGRYLYGATDRYQLDEREQTTLLRFGL
jgi:hypothetical protein